MTLTERDMCNVRYLTVILLSPIRYPTRLQLRISMACIKPWPKCLSITSWHATADCISNVCVCLYQADVLKQESSRNAPARKRPRHRQASSGKVINPPAAASEMVATHGNVLVTSCVCVCWCLRIASWILQVILLNLRVNSISILMNLGGNSSSVLS